MDFRFSIFFGRSLLELTILSQIYGLNFIVSQTTIEFSLKFVEYLSFGLRSKKSQIYRAFFRIFNTSLSLTDQSSLWVKSILECYAETAQS